MPRTTMSCLPRQLDTVTDGVYADVRVTGSPGIKDDLINAGGGLWKTPCVMSIALHRQPPSQ